MRPRIMPYGFTVDSMAYELCAEWCAKEFGELQRDDKGRWTRRYNRFFRRMDASIYFRNDVDAVAFKLRWL